jgi:hypothetical protein
VRRPGKTTTTYLVVAAVAAYLGLRTFVFPATPVLLGGDQAFFWMYAERMLRGERVYLDFFQFTPPGTDLVFLAAFKVLGPRIWVTNAIVVAVGTALGGVCFRVARHMMDDGLAALATALFTVLVFGQPLGATHHWFSVLAVMIAIPIVTSSSNERRFVAAGALLGIASFFTQTHGAAALAAFLTFGVWQAQKQRISLDRSIRRAALLLGAFAVTLLAASGYFLANAGAANLWSILFSYAWHRMGASPFTAGLGLPEAPTGRALRWLAPYLLVYAIVPAGYALTATSCWQERPEYHAERQRTSLLTWLVGVALLLEVAMGLSWLRLFAVSMPGIILFVSAIGRVGRWRRPLLGIAWLGVLGLGCALVRSTYRHHALAIDFPGGRAATDGSNRDKLLWIGERIPAGGLLFAADRPSVYLPLGLHNPLFLDAAVPSRQTRLVDVERAITELEASGLRTILWSPALEDPKADADMAAIAALRTYLHDRYRPVHAFADGDAVWERR